MSKIPTYPTPPTQFSTYPTPPTLHLLFFLPCKNQPTYPTPPAICADMSTYPTPPTLHPRPFSNPSQVHRPSLPTYPTPPTLHPDFPFHRHRQPTYPTPPDSYGDLPYTQLPPTKPANLPTPLPTHLILMYRVAPALPSFAMSVNRPTLHRLPYTSQDVGTYPTPRE